MTRVPCPACKGTKRITLTVSERGKPTTEMEINCVTCKDGTISQVEQDVIDSFWCKCGNPSGESDYHPDHGGMKHHYTCRDCGAITQVG